ETFVAARRPEKHHDALAFHPEATAPFRGIGAAGLPRDRVPYMRDQRAPEALLEEARGYRHSVGERSETLAEPGPRQAIRVAEVERAPDRAPEARPNVEAQLPVVDVEEEGPPARDTPEIADARASQPRLGGVDEVAIGAAREIGHGGDEPRHAPGGDARVANGPGGHRFPDSRERPRSYQLDRAEGVEQLRQEI